MITIVEGTVNDFSGIKDLAHAIWPATYGSILSVKQLSYMAECFLLRRDLER